MQVIKWFDEPFWTQNVVLGDAPFVMSVNYNTRNDSWFMDLTTNDDVPLIYGKRITLDTDMFNNIHSELRPKGVLLVVPVAANVLEITRDNMGIEIELIFIGDDEVL